MRATGIVRRIDDLGRIIIPKEIRREMRIIEGDPFEIFLDKEKNSVILQKYETSKSDKENILMQFDEIAGESDSEEVRNAFEQAAEIVKNILL